MIEQALSELEQYLQLAGGKLPPDLEERARQVAAFANRRMRAGEQTVVALSGATGSGKSSLFNAISGTSLAQVAARRPTTSQPLALSFSATNEALLELLAIGQRREARPPIPDFADVVLLDLPDHDSIRDAHREEVDRLVRIVDQFVFVVDPQKYADNLLHERYLRPLREHSDVITVVLNHADVLTDGAPIYPGPHGMDERVEDVIAHLRTLLEADGLHGVPVFATNARDGEGVDLLQRHLGRVAAHKRATRERLTADLRGLAHELRQVSGQSIGMEEAAVDELKREVRAAAGVERRAESIRRTVRSRGAMVQGWRGAKGAHQLELPSHQVASAADDARATSAIRRFLSTQTASLPERWRDDARRRIMGGSAATLPTRLDQVMRDVDLSDMDAPFGWGLVRGLKWLPVVALVGVAGWVVYQFVWASGEFAPKVVTVIVATLVALVLISLSGDAILRLTANRAGRQTAKRLGSAVDEEVEASVIADVQAELDDHQRAAAALARLDGILARD